ncbi:hypothetical protein PPL_11994 [Heterostelium album PN500]|uniref:Uncharacterized protein n=1 Tax=Heterostelium pallidum (strain ATCC 26659 / Pp 5 / PN500) TaxID=670386 RepID=D3BV22_HETP5|nr:hypothetical protein PPL_11994 [Heterostelium album PN500]EFA74960.1 hypothetical protein PPL_11994 [Heterostelium album PN500]|eukprot:XP_020427094.1 hypothetical protein PPL_11994 [Heterostelium album PN500]
MEYVRFYGTINNGNTMFGSSIPVDCQGWSQILNIGTLPPPGESDRPGIYFFFEKEKQIRSEEKPFNMVVSYVGIASGLLFDELQDVFNSLESTTINPSLTNCTHYIYYAFPTSYIIHPLLFLYKQVLESIFYFPSQNININGFNNNGTLLDGELVDIIPIMECILNSKFQDLPSLFKLNELLCHVPSEQRINIQSLLANTHLCQNQLYKQSNLIYKYLEVVEKLKLSHQQLQQQQQSQQELIQQDQVLPMENTNIQQTLEIESSNPTLDPFGFTHLNNVIRRAILKELNNE